MDFDRNSFNEAAQSVWDTAYAKGLHDGMEAEERRQASQRVAEMLEVARDAAMLAIKLDPASNEGRHARQVVRSALGKVPLLPPVRRYVNEAIRELDKHKHHVADPVNLPLVLSWIAEAAGA